MSKILCLSRRLLIIAAALVASSCSGSFFASAAGDLQRGVTFSFYDSVTRDRMKEYDLDEFQIEREMPNGGWTTTWLIHGRGRVGTVRYGSPPSGFSVDSVPQSLEAGANYRLFAKSTSWPSGVSYASLLFGIGKDGVARFDQSARVP
jgi:hypothetical protein